MTSTLKRTREEPVAASHAPASSHWRPPQTSKPARNSPRSHRKVQIPPCTTAQPSESAATFKNLDYRAIANVLDAFEDSLMRSILDAHPAVSYPGPDVSQALPLDAGWDPMSRRPSSSSCSALDIDLDSSSSSSSFAFSPPPGSPASSFECEDEPPLWASALKHDAFLVDPPPLLLSHVDGRHGSGYARNARGTSRDAGSHTRGSDTSQTSSAVGQSLSPYFASVASMAYPTSTDASWPVSSIDESSQSSSALFARPDPGVQLEVSPEYEESEGYPWLARPSLRLLQQNGREAYPDGMGRRPLLSAPLQRRGSQCRAQSKPESTSVMPDGVEPTWQPLQPVGDIVVPSPGRYRDGNHSGSNGLASPSPLPSFPPLSTLPASCSSTVLSTLPHLPPMPPSSLDPSRRGTVTARYTRGMMTAQDAARSYPGEWGEAFR